MDDLVKSVLRMQYDSPDNYTKTSAENMKKTALHEAGHLVASEVLCPGSVGLASLRATGRDSTGGFIHRCKELTRRPYHVLVSLAGKAAVELYYSDTCASGCQNDINRAIELTKADLLEKYGINLCEEIEDNNESNSLENAYNVENDYEQMELVELFMPAMFTQKIAA